MMKEFMQTHRIFLTPISPIHIGCGEDFEPTNYVIDSVEKVLYSFEPSNLQLTEVQKDKLLSYINNSSKDQLGKIYSFFANEDDIFDQIKSKCKYVVSISNSIISEWEKKLGKEVNLESDSKVFNKLLIERNIHNPISNQSYIPGSSIKGGVITAYLNNSYSKEKPILIELEKDDLDNYLKNKFIGNNNDLERQNKLYSQCIKISDFMPVKNSFTKVVYANNYLKEGKLDKGKMKYIQGISSRREAIVEGQYRGYSGIFTFLENRLNIKDIIIMLRDFYHPIFEKECEKQIKMGLLDQKYYKNIKDIIKNEDVSLIRIGKSGSEDKVYQDHSIRKIEVKLNKNERLKKNKNTENRSESKTYWLSADKADQDSNVIPFGWGILEYKNLDRDNEKLRKWCSSRAKTKYQSKIEHEDAEKLAAQAIQDENNKLNSLSEKQRLVAEKVKFWSSQPRMQYSSSIVFKEAKILLEEATENWSEDDKKYLYDVLNLNNKENILYKKILHIEPLIKPKDKKSQAGVFKKLLDNLL